MSEKAEDGKEVEDDADQGDDEDRVSKRNGHRDVCDHEPDDEADHGERDDELDH